MIIRLLIAEAFGIELRHIARQHIAFTAVVVIAQFFERLGDDQFIFDIVGAKEIDGIGLAGCAVLNADLAAIQFKRRGQIAFARNQKALPS